MIQYSSIKRFASLPSIKKLVVTNYNGYPFIKNVAAKYIIYSALKHLKVSSEKLE